MADTFPHKWTLESVMEHLCALISALDTKQTGRFEMVERVATAAIHAADEKYNAQFQALERSFIAMVTALNEQHAVRFTALEKSMSAALHAAEQATLKAEAASEKRLDSVNEFRNTLSDQQRNLMPRSEVGVVAGALSDKITALETTLAGRTSALETSLTNRVTASDTAMASKINALEKQLDTFAAERQGIKGGWGYAVGIIGFMLAVGSLVMIGVRFVMSTP